MNVSLSTKNIEFIPRVIVTCDIPFGDSIYAVDTILASIQDLGCHLGPHPASVYLQGLTTLRSACSEQGVFCNFISFCKRSDLFILQAALSLFLSLGSMIAAMPAKILQRLLHCNLLYIQSLQRPKSNTYSKSFYRQSRGH